MRAGVAFLAVALGACGDPASSFEGGQTGEEVPAPCLASAVPIGWEEAPSSVGRSPAAWVAGWPAEGWAATLAWEGGGAEALAVALDVDPTSARLVVQEPSAPSVDPADCRDHLQVAATLTLTAESLVGTAAVTVRSEGDLGWFGGALDDPEAALTAAGAELDGATDPMVDVSGGVGPAASWGALAASGLADASGGWAPLGAWGSPPE